MSAMAANTPSGATSINEQARNLYRIEARRLAASKRLLNSNDFLKAFMLISNSRLESNPQANLRLLLDNKLLNNRSYESTLRQNMGFSRDEAQAAIKLANAQMNSISLPLKKRRVLLECQAAPFVVSSRFGKSSKRSCRNCRLTITVPKTPIRDELTVIPVRRPVRKDKVGFTLY